MLVIRLGALGDFFLSMPAFAAIRAHEAGAKVTLLTTAPFVEIARRAPWFDAVATDDRAAPWNVPGILALVRTLRGHDFVYDLQTSRRSNRYFWFAGRPPWSGIAAGCAAPHANAARDAMHTLERQHEQLVMAGVRDFPTPDLRWLTGGPIPDLPRPFALLVPGAAPHRPAKRWPAARYAELAATLRARGIAPVVIGGAAETGLAGEIRGAIDLTGRTSLFDVAALAASAAFAVGNDTGPMHIAATVGCRCVVLFSADSDPALTTPRGPDGAWPIVLRAPDLASLPVETVVAALP